MNKDCPTPSFLDPEPFYRLLSDSFFYKTLHSYSCLVWHLMPTRIFFPGSLSLLVTAYGEENPLCLVLFGWLEGQKQETLPRPHHVNCVPASALLSWVRDRRQIWPPPPPGQVVQCQLRQLDPQAGLQSTG